MKNAYCGMLAAAEQDGPLGNSGLMYKETNKIFFKRAFLLGHTF